MGLAVLVLSSFDVAPLPDHYRGLGHNHAFGQCDHRHRRCSHMSIAPVPPVDELGVLILWMSGDHRKLSQAKQLLGAAIPAKKKSHA